VYSIKAEFIKIAFEGFYASKSILARNIGIHTFHEIFLVVIFIRKKDDINTIRIFIYDYAIGIRRFFDCLVEIKENKESSYYQYYQGKS
jgi:hypothetical protein